jgi:polysaccharide export outer membrane protein
MPPRSSSARQLALLLLSVVPLILSPSTDAQTSDSSVAGAGLQILQGLTPEQRDAISQQMGGAAGGTPSGLGGANARGADQLQQDQINRQNEQRAQMEVQKAEIDRLSPYLKGEDWIVVTIDFNPLPPPSPQTNWQQLGAGANGVTPQSATGNAAQNGLNQVPNQQPITVSPIPGTSQASGAAAAASIVNPNSVPATTTAGGYTLPPQPTPGQTNNANQQEQRPELTEEERRQRDALIELIRSKNPYQLTHDGLLLLPGFEPMPLAGLTEQLATLRMGVEASLRNLFIRVTKLPLKKGGPTALKPFGYDLFDHEISTFAPTTNVPVPADYLVGPGDELDVQLYGNQNRDLRLYVGRDGRVSFPELGPIQVGGETFNAVKANLESRVGRQMIGVHASISMGDTRSIRVFVLGDAKRPGSYVISGLGTITSALFASGGVQPIGSLRNIQLKRHGSLVRRLDLYDMLIRGDTTDDARLLPGDTIFVPPVGATVTVDGEVHRPAIYEIRNEASIADLVQLAGGLTPDADTSKVALTRIDEDLRRVVLQVDLNGVSAKIRDVRNGDILHISQLRPTLDAGILVQGYVYTTGAFAFHDGMRLTDVIPSVDDLKPNADLHYVLIRRELPPDRRVTVTSADLAAALAAPHSDADIPLMARDRLTVFDLQSSRDRVIQPILNDLKLQSSITRPDEVVRIEGRANVPGEYPFQSGMTVRDLIRAGGGLSDAAYGGTAELTRYQVINGESRQTEVIKVDLTAALRGDPAAALLLQPFDTLSIKEVQAWTDREEIALRGEVRFPGKYAIKRGETLKSVLLRAGGLTDYAFAEGSVFTRKELRDREQRQLDLLAVRMQEDIQFAALEGATANQSGAATALSVGQSLLTQLRASRAVGRLVINLPRLLRAPIGSPYDVMLRNNDELIVPKLQQEVTVIGEVQTATSHLYRPGLSRDDYIGLSGGETIRADKRRIYVVRADGSVVASGSRWFTSSHQSIQPGDTVVVPLNAEHMPPLPLWQAISQILYNVAIATLAVHEF